MNQNVINTIAVILLIIFIFLLMFIPIKINKKICEENGGKYIWSSSQYETKCHLNKETK